MQEEDGNPVVENQGLVEAEDSGDLDQADGRQGVGVGNAKVRGRKAAAVIGHEMSEYEKVNH